MSAVEKQQNAARRASTILFVFLVSWLDPFGLSSGSSEHSQDILYRIIAPFYDRHAREDIAVVLVDDSTLDYLSGDGEKLSWPIPYYLHATVLDSLRESGVAGVVVDISLKQPPEENLPQAADDMYADLAQAVESFARDGIPLVLVQTSEERYVAGKKTKELNPFNPKEPALQYLINYLDKAFPHRSEWTRYIGFARYEWNANQLEYPMSYADTTIMPAVALYRLAVNAGKLACDSAEANCNVDTLHHYLQDLPAGDEPPQMLIQWASAHYKIPCGQLTDEAVAQAEEYAQLSPFGAFRVRLHDEFLAQVVEKRRCEPAYTENYNAALLAEPYYVPFDGSIMMLATLSPAQRKQVVAASEKTDPLLAENIKQASSFYDSLKGRFIFYGANVSPTLDLHETPINGQVPGVFLHAMAFDNLLTRGIGYWREIAGHFLGLDLDTWLSLSLFAGLYLGHDWLTAKSEYRHSKFSTSEWRDTRANFVHNFLELIKNTGIALAGVAFILVVCYALALLNYPPVNWIGIIGAGAIIEFPRFVEGLLLLVYAACSVAMIGGTSIWNTIMQNTKQLMGRL